MPVFMNTGGGDIYAGETREACIKAMREDLGDKDFAEIEPEIFEIDGSTKMRLENEDGTPGELVPLSQEYTNLGYGYCIASTNC